MIWNAVWIALTVAVLAAGRRSRRRAHQPRAMFLTDPDSPHAMGQCDCETVMSQARCGYVRPEPMATPGDLEPHSR